MAIQFGGACLCLVCISATPRCCDWLFSKEKNHPRKPLFLKIAKIFEILGRTEVLASGDPLHKDPGVNVVCCWKLPGVYLGIFFVFCFPGRSGPQESSFWASKNTKNISLELRAMYKTVIDISYHFFCPQNPKVTVLKVLIPKNGNSSNASRNILHHPRL